MTDYYPRRVMSVRSVDPTVVRDLMACPVCGALTLLEDAELHYRQHVPAAEED